MARIRTVKPEFFRSRSLARCSRDARLTFAGLWTEADDYGRGVADPRILKGALWALDDDIGPSDVTDHLEILAATGHIHLYEIDGDPFFEVVNWNDHQASAYRRGEAKYPAPDGVLTDVSHVDVQKNASRTSSRAGREGKGEEGKGEREASKAARATRLPEGWKPNPEPELVEAIGGQKAAAEQFARFSDYWLAQPGQKGCKSDWQATWRNWLRRSQDFRPAGAVSGVSPVKKEDVFGSDEWERKQAERRERAAALTGESA